MCFLFTGSTHDRNKGLEPEFDVQLPNLTIKQGSDASFTCVVKHLGEYKVLLSFKVSKNYFSFKKPSNVTSFQFVCPQN